MTRPLRVLHLIYDDPGNPWVAGGGSVRVREIYRRLTDRLAEVTVATGAYPGAQDETIDGIRYRRLGVEAPYVLSRATYTARASLLLAKGDYDAAVFDFSTYVPLWIPADRPVGVTVHHVTGASARERWGPTLGRIVAWQEAARLRRAPVLSATSARTEERLRAMIGSGPRILRVGAGVPDHLFQLPRRDDGFLLFFGRLDWFQKGLDTLLDAVALLARERPGIHLKIAGRGRETDRVVEYVRKLGIESNVTLLGAVDDSARDALFSTASVLLMPSRFEGFGMVAAEAMAAGLPIVASDVDSLPEVVDPPNGGVLIPVGDAAALARETAALLDDPDRRKRVSKTAQTSAGRFKWSRIADAHLSFLQSIACSGHEPDRRLENGGGLNDSPPES